MEFNQVLKYSVVCCVWLVLIYGIVSMYKRLAQFCKTRYCNIS